MGDNRIERNELSWYVSIGQIGKYEKQQIHLRSLLSNRVEKICVRVELYNETF